VLALDPNSGKIKWASNTRQRPLRLREISEHQIINAKVNGEDRKLVVHGARNGFYYALDRVNGAFVAGKQYVDQLTWTKASTRKPAGRSSTILRRTCSPTWRGATRHAPIRWRRGVRRRPAARTGSLGLIIPN